jgi:peroxiredoxin Q/BCP
MIKLLCIFFAGVALSFSNSQADPLAVGSTAPALVAPDQDGKPVDFGQVYAQGITLVYFYPKAGTSGCTAEACSLRDSYDKLTGQGLHIIGVSRDTASDQKKFKTDPEGTVAKAFGVPSIPLINLDSRVSFIVKNGKIAWSSLHAQTKGSAKEVQVALDSLKS